jgi:hypothetical protein
MLQFAPPAGDDNLNPMQLTIEIPDELAKELEPERERMVEIIRRGLKHSSPGALSAVEEVFEFLGRRPTPQEIISFKPSEKAVKRLRQLLDKNREGSISADEEAELDTLESLDDLFALVKLQAR